MENLPKTLTDAQYEIFQQFKRNVADILSPNDTDPFLIKWLNSRNYNLRKAERCFRQVTAFREFYQVYQTLETYKKPEVAEKYEYTALLGFAKDGTIVRYSQLGRGDHYGFIVSLSAYEVGIFAALIVEQDLKLQRERNKETGKSINEITYIFDLEGISIQEIMHRCVYEMGFDLMYLVQEYYPEIWGNIFIINVPPYFDTLFNMFKPILRMNVLSKFHVVSRDSVPQILLKYIDEDVLPAFLGGKKVDSSGNPKCTEFLRFGGKIPRSYHRMDRPSLQPTDPGVTALWLGPRGVFNHSIVVRKPSTKIRVEVRTENGSIHMSIFFRKFGPNPDVLDIPAADEYLDEKDEKSNVQRISPEMRVQVHLAPIDDSNHTPWPGIYIFNFNNSNSWFSSRRLIFRIKLMDS